MEPGDGALAKLDQAQPSSTKLTQIKPADLTWFNSSESGLFKGLRRIPNYFFSPGVFAASGRLAGRGLDPANGKTYSTQF
jgi:hypothetical protein